jgi:hypothetical protein
MTSFQNWPFMVDSWQPLIQGFHKTCTQKNFAGAIRANHVKAAARQPAA